MRKFILASLAIMSTSAFAANEMYVLGGVGINEDDTGAQFTVGSQILDTNFYLESTMNYIDSDSNDVISDVNGDLTKYKGDYQHFKMSLAPMYKYSFDDSFAIYGKVGLAYSNFNSKSTWVNADESDTHKYSDSKWGAIYGIGAEFKSAQPMFGNSKFMARVGFDWYDFSSGSMNLGSDATLGLQAGFTF
ncbi:MULTISPECIES: outer membrane beta-barrel protein [unclassified Vibrio]|uniref:outer membrane beta-barrel protein n=1 Tax=unclassified Vibrio TaxID=2614977 RepID=UPI0020BE20CC|nr:MULTISPECIES: outer membrane beta-barrel protein [unclassified Vibrio]MCK8073206.1 porin family protein [Vibrio sp. 1CM23M]MCK8087373.1 porin family protein [Vibrio sp. 1CM8B]